MEKVRNDQASDTEILLTMVGDMIAKMKTDEDYKKQCIEEHWGSMSIERSSTFFVKIPQKVEKERLDNFEKSELKKVAELNQDYIVSPVVFQEFLDKNSGYEKVHLELIHLENFTHSDSKRDFNRLQFAFYTDVNAKDKYILMDTVKPILITKPDGSFVANNIFSKRLKGLLDNYTETKSGTIISKKINTQIITLDRKEDVEPIMAFQKDILFKPGISDDNIFQMMHYRKWTYRHQYTLIMKPVDVDGKSFNDKVYDTFCLNPPDNC